MIFKVIFKKDEFALEPNCFTESRSIEGLEQKLKSRRFIKVFEGTNNREFLLNIDEIRCVVPDEIRTAKELEKYNKEIERMGGNIFE